MNSVDSAPAGGPLEVQLTKLIEYTVLLINQVRNLFVCYFLCGVPRALHSAHKLLTTEDVVYIHYIQCGAGIVFLFA